MIRSPMQKEDLHLTLDDRATVSQVKAMIHVRHESMPAPPDQRLIFAGKLLADEAKLLDILGQLNLREPHIFHLMISHKSQSPSATSPEKRRASLLEAMPHADAALAPSAAPPSGPSSEPVRAPAAVRLAESRQDLDARGFSARQNGAHPGGLPERLHSTQPQQPPLFAQAQLLQQQQQALLPTQQLLWMGAGVNLVAQEIHGQPYVFALPQLPALLGDMVYMPGASAAAVPACWFEQQTAVSAPPVGAPAAAATDDAGAEAERAAALRLPAQPPVMPAGGAGAVAGREALLGNGEEEHTDGLKLLLKLALFVYILSQDGGSNRVILLTASAVIIYLAQTGWLDVVRRFAERQLQPQPAVAVAPPTPTADAAGGGGDEPIGDAADADLAAAEATAGGEAHRGGEAPAPPRSLLRDVETVLVAFVTSLFPS